MSRMAYVKNGNSIFVTGGAGFISSNFVHHWLANCDDIVINLDKLTCASDLSSLQSVRDDVRHLVTLVEIGDQELVRKMLVQYQLRAVVSFDSESYVDRSSHGPGNFIHTNAVSTFIPLESVRAYWSTLDVDAQDAFKFLHVSADEEYVTLSQIDPSISETDSYELNPHYSPSKAELDQLVRSLQSD